ncbi:N-acetylmuramoyl-L-alanine amidase [Pseudomonas asplenii]|uniref:N-acetylmuramoyl-L-alanine amidase n=1 Tax=Pseudomonas asplenii TaxID=53407 RepID=UPI0006B4F597|nr:N-acetylmuramoyl-L-alanine amidase [Pseudomonas fuscovaginae]KPA99418.1 negative regulator of beta-lactamase expression [Pseudomonas fuscovaginae]
MKPINYKAYRSTRSLDERVRLLVLHYTAGDFATSVAAFTGPSVSCHYLVPDVTDPSYIQAGFSQQEVFSLVDEGKSAWHAGVSAWGGRTRLNDSSIGIEIVNLASESEGAFHFPPYEPRQIEAVKQLALNILARYPNIGPTQVLGHSDIAWRRKSDPGAAFPWRELYLAGVGAWFDEATRDSYQQQYIRDGLPSQTAVLALFQQYGYEVTDADTPEGLKQLVRAFQLHFRPTNYDGVMDAESAAILAALVAKYFPTTA